MSKADLVCSPAKTANCAANSNGELFSIACLYFPSSNSKRDLSSFMVDNRFDNSAISCLRISLYICEDKLANDCWVKKEEALTMGFELGDDVIGGGFSFISDTGGLSATCLDNVSVDLFLSGFEGARIDDVPGRGVFEKDSPVEMDAGSVISSLMRLCFSLFFMWSKELSSNNEK